MKKIFLAIMLTCGVLFIANAKTCYVRTDGNNSNTGLNNTPTSAWKTIKFAFSKLTAGDTLYVADGTYNEYALRLQLTGGSKTVRTTIKSINKWGAKIILDAPGTTTGLQFLDNGYIFDGFEVTWKADPIAAHVGVGFEQGNWFTIRNCNIHHCPFGGIQGAYCDNVLIENNYLHDNFSQIGTENGSGISIWHPEGIEENVGGFNIIYRNNICYNNWATNNVGDWGRPTDGNGLIVDDFKCTQDNSMQPYPYKTLVENNLCYNNGGAGISIFNSDKVTARNNTCYLNGRILKDYGECSNFSVGDCANNEIYNNISVSDNTGPKPVTAFKLFSDGNNTKLNNNLFCGANAFWTWNTTTTLTSGTNKGNRTNKEIKYPAFVNPGTGVPSEVDFHLKSNSPAINTGNNTLGSETDLDGNLRPQDNTTDLGCYEYLLNTGSNELLLEPSDLTPKITIFPNPVKGNSITISLNEKSKAGDTSVAIIDLTGKVFYETALASQQKEISIQRSYLPKAGLYLVRVTNNKLIFTCKLIMS